jgi:O-antigen/teichoic acid export membrane protein
VVSAATNPPGDALQRKALAGSAWTLGGFGAAQTLRLGGNLILTRLLVPEAFGLMALVSIVVQGVEMFSDVGVRGSIVHHARGAEPRFLNTAWTFKVLRGFVLWTLMSLLALPAADFYGAPELHFLVPAAAAKAILDGFASTSVFTLVRDVQPARRVIMDIGSAVVSLGVSVGIAVWVMPTVWALVAGGVAASITQCIWSHFLIAGPRNRFAWDPEAARSLLRFGRWMFISTSLVFLLAQGDKMALGKLMTSAELGVYGVAFTLVQTLLTAAQRLSGNVLFPVYAELARHGSETLQKRMTRIRLTMMSVFLPPLCALVIAGEELVRWLYDARYVNAGWIVQILAAGAIARVLTLSGERAILAHGDSFRHMMLQVGRAALFILGMVLGGWWGGTTGLILGSAAAHFVAYIPYAVAVRPFGTWTPGVDLLVLSVTAGICALGHSALHNLL